nr:DUF1467 family protein [Sphingomicrobium lutaoense]
MLPFGVRTDEEVGAPKVPGQADSAPHKFDLKRHLLKAGGIAILLTLLYVANYEFGWITADQLDFYN